MPRQVVVLPGNPGSAAYFKPFMLAVHERLCGQADVLAVTHAGHDPETDHGGRLWDLRQQIAHKVALLREHVLLPGRPPAVLVGHSIGAAMAIKAVAEVEGFCATASQEQQQQQGEEGEAEEGKGAAGRGKQLELPTDSTPRVAKLLAVFPFFETNFGGSWRQRGLRTLAPWYDWLGWVGAAVTSLPRALRRAFVRLNAAMDSNAVDLTCLLLSRHTVRNAFYLATHEFKATWHPDLRHAFCVSERQSAAVAEAVAAVARSIPDLDLDLDLDVDLELACARSVSVTDTPASMSRLSSSGTTTSSSGIVADCSETPTGNETTCSETRHDTLRVQQGAPIWAAEEVPGGKPGSPREVEQQQSNRHANHHQPQDDQLVPFCQTSQQRRELYGDDVVAGHHRSLTVAAPASRVGGGRGVDGDVDDAADQSFADGASGLLYGKATWSGASGHSGPADSRLAVASLATSGGGGGAVAMRDAA